MKMRHWVWLFCVFVSFASLGAQTVKQAETAFRDSLMNQNLVLRDFDGSANVHAHWTGTQMDWGKVPWQEVSILKLDSVSVKDQQVVLQGQRLGLRRDKQKSLVLANLGERVRITVDFDGDPITALAGLKNALFFSSLQDVLAAIPEDYKRYVPMFTDGTQPERSSPTTPNTLCDCADRGTPSCDADKARRGLKAPEALRVVTPTYTREASLQHISGSVMLALRLNQTGEVSDIWVEQPLGYGLDAQAADAVRQTKIKPATCHGKPIISEFNIEENFTVF